MSITIESADYAIEAEALSHNPHIRAMAVELVRIGHTDTESFEFTTTTRAKASDYEVFGSYIGAVGRATKIAMAAIEAADRDELADELAKDELADHVAGLVAKNNAETLAGWSADDYRLHSTGMHVEIYEIFKYFGSTVDPVAAVHLIKRYVDQPKS